MAFTVSNAKDDLEGMSHGGTLDNIQNLTQLINRAAREVITRIDADETIQIAQISGAIHSDVFDYTAPADLKSNKIIDIRPQVKRSQSDNLAQYLSKEFDLKKEIEAGRNKVTVVNDNATKFLRFSKSISPAPKVIDSVNDITGNGTWSVFGDATNLTEDNVNYISGSASLNFDLDGATTSGGLTNSTLTAVDLSTHDEQSSLFVWLFIPDASAVTNVDLRWGNSASVYWNRTVTQAHHGAFQDGWNLLRFDWNGATETGTVDATQIDYLRINITYNGSADTDFRLDNITSSLGSIFEIVYYSKYFFRDSAGVFKEQTDNDTDIINLDTDSYNIFLNQVMLFIAQQSQGEDSGFDVSFYKQELYGNGSQENVGLYRLYQMHNPSQAIKVSQTYYDLPSGAGK